MKQHPKFIQMIGKTFGNWTVIQIGDKQCQQNRNWLCRCSCGVERKVWGHHLRSGKSKSCGKCQHLWYGYLNYEIDQEGVESFGITLTSQLQEMSKEAQLDFVNVWLQTLENIADDLEKQIKT